RYLKKLVGVHTVRVLEMTVTQSANLTQHSNHFFVRRYQMHDRFGAASSVSASTSQHMRNCSQNDGPVQFQRPILDVGNIHSHPSIEINAIATGNSPQACKSRAHTEAASLPTFVPIDFFGQRRPRPYQRHVAAQYIVELRQ